MQAKTTRKIQSTYTIGRFVHRNLRSILLGYLFIVFTACIVSIYFHMEYRNAPKFQHEETIDIRYSSPLANEAPKPSSEKTIPLNLPISGLMDGQHDSPIFEIIKIPKVDIYSFLTIQMSMYVFWVRSLYISDEYKFLQKQSVVSSLSSFLCFMRENLPSILGGIIISFFTFNYWREIEISIILGMFAHSFLDIFCIKNYQLQN